MSIPSFTVLLYKSGVWWGLNYIGMLYYMIGPDSLVARASASGTLGRGFAPRPRHTKGDKNGTGSSLADARNKSVVPGR